MLGATPSVRTAVIPAAGRGARMLLASRVVPKELMPLVDRPVLHYALEEAAAAGIRRTVLIIARGKEAITEYARSSGFRDMEIVQAYQDEPRGLGHAVLCARGAVAGEPFAVLLPDVVTAKPGALAALMRAAQGTGAGCALSVAEMPADLIARSGVLVPGPFEGDVCRVKGLVEKPAPGREPSRLGIIGRYILTPTIFDALADTPPGTGGEVQLTDAIVRLLAEQEMVAHVWRGEWHDTGTPLGLLQASVKLALGRDDLGPQLRAWLQELKAGF